MDLYDLFNAKEFDEQRSFYQREKRIIDMIKADLHMNRSTMKYESEKVEERKAQNWAAIQERIAHREQVERYIFDVFLYRRFCWMCRKAVALAAECNFDVRVSFHRNSRGGIKLRTDGLLFQRDLQEAQYTMAKLFSSADDVWSDLIEQDGETLVEFTFSYEIYRTVRVKVGR